MMHLIVALWWWIQRASGASNTTGVAYGFWSGFGSDLTEFAILGGVIQMYRKHLCHVKGCARVAKHPVEGTPYAVCKRHHPDLPNEDIEYFHIVHADKRAKLNKEQ